MMDKRRLREIANNNAIGATDFDLEGFAAAIQREIAGSGEAVAEVINQYFLGHDNMYRTIAPIVNWERLPTGTKLYLHPAQCEKCAELERRNKINNERFQQQGDECLRRAEAVEAKCAQIEAETQERCADHVKTNWHMFATEAAAELLADELRALKPAGEQK